jgi:hypothetical protein
MVVTPTGDPDVFHLTFTQLPVDMAVLNGTEQPADASIGWDVVFGPLVIDRTTRVVDGTFALYDIAPLAGQETLTVSEGATTHLEATLAPKSQIAMWIGGTLGGLDTVAGDLEDLSVPDDGGSVVFQAFAGEDTLDFGFSYSGLDIDSILTNGGMGVTGVTGFIQVTPEPATLAFLGAGAAAVLAVRRRRRR